MATTPSDSPRSSIAGWFLAAIALVVLALVWGEQLDPLAKTTFGVAVGDSGAGPYVANVLHGSAADTQGIKPGDSIDVRDLTTSSRFRLYVGSPPGTQLAVRVGRAGLWRNVTLTAMPNPLRDPRWTMGAGATLALLIVALIGYRKPSHATAALVLCGCGSVTTFGLAAEFSWLPDPWFGGVVEACRWRARAAELEGSLPLSNAAAAD